MSIAKLDPNYLVVTRYTKDNLSLLLAELGAKGLSCDCRPGHDLDSVYVFVRDDSNRLLKIVEMFDFVEKVSPLYESQQRAALSGLATELISKKLFPSGKDLVQLAEVTWNPKLAMYFAFVKSYTRCLMPLAVFGVLLRLFRPSQAEFNTCYAIVVLLWGITFTTLWKYRYEPAFSKEFGFKTSIPLDDSRVTFVKKLCFIPVAILFVAFLVTFQLCCFALEIFLTQIYEGPLKAAVSLLPTILLSVFVPVLTLIYNVFVNKMTAWENGTNPSRSKVEKNFVFAFLTSYVPLMITLFLYFPFGHLLNLYLPTIANYSSILKIPIDSRVFKLNLSRYQTQFFYFTVTNQVILLFMENALPIVLGKVLPLVNGEKKSASTKSRTTKLIKEQFSQDATFLEQVREYETGPWGLFSVDDNIRKLVLQFGFVVIFSTIWPIAPLICIVFNIIIMKLDIWRALIKSAPVVDVKAAKDIIDEEAYESIKLTPWDSVLTFITWFSSLVTPALLMMYKYTELPGIGHSLQSRSAWYQVYPFHYDLKTILLWVFFFEHIALFVTWAVYKIFQSPQANLSETFIPAEELKEPPKLNLNNVLTNTVQFMDSLSSTGHPVAVKSPPVTELKTSDKQSKTSGTDFETTEDSKITQRKPVSAAPLQAPTPLKPTHLALTTNGTSKECPNSSSTSVSSSVAGATVPLPIPTSKNFDLRNSTPNIESASVITISSVPQVLVNSTSVKSPSKKDLPSVTQTAVLSSIPKTEINPKKTDGQQFVSSKALEPEKQFINDNKVTATPQAMAATSQTVAATPQKVSATPQKLAAIPQKVAATPQKQVVSDNPAKAAKLLVKKDNESLISTSSVKKKKKSLMSPLGKLKKKF